MKISKNEKIITSILEDRVKNLEEMTNIQTSNGNWNYDNYMLGMANGMIYSLNLMQNDFDNPYTGQKSKRPFLEAPKKWLCDKKTNYKIIEGL